MMMMMMMIIIIITTIYETNLCVILFNLSSFLCLYSRLPPERFIFKHPTCAPYHQILTTYYTLQSDES